MTKHIRKVAVLGLLLGSSCLAVADGPDALWEVTTKMEMAGMPMAMPAHTAQVCQPKSRPQEASALPKAKNSDCKMADMHRSGGKTSFKVVCSGKTEMTGTGEFENTGDSYHGTMHMVGTADGQAIDMTQTVSGKKIGTCTYEDPGKKYQQQMAAMTADACKKSIDDLNWQVYENDRVPACKPYKKAFCDHLKQVGGTMHSPAGFRGVAEQHRDWEQMFGVCGMDAQGVAADACRQSEALKDWQFVADYCPVRGQTIAQEQCAGRDYTVAMSGPYAALCRKYAMAQMQRSVKPQTSPAEAVKEGVKNSLKKLLPF